MSRVTAASTLAMVWWFAAACTEPSQPGSSQLEVEPWAPWPYVGVHDLLRYEQDELRFYPGYIDVGAGRELRYPATPARHFLGPIRGQTDRTKFWVESRDWKLADFDVVSGALAEVVGPTGDGPIVGWVVRDDGATRELFARTGTRWWRKDANWTPVPAIDGQAGHLVAAGAALYGLTGVGNGQRLHRWQPATGSWSLVASGVDGVPFAIPGGSVGLAALSGVVHLYGPDGSDSGALAWPGTAAPTACSPTRFARGDLQSFDRGRTWAPIARLRPGEQSTAIECIAGHAIERHDYVSFERAADGSLPVVGSAPGPMTYFDGALDLGNRSLGLAEGGLRWSPDAGWALTDLPGLLSQARGTLHLYEFDAQQRIPVHRWSDDGGRTWQSRAVTVDGDPVSPCDPVVFAGAVAWAGCTGGPHSPPGPLLRSTDGGHSFVTVATPGVAVRAGLSTGEALLDDGTMTLDGRSFTAAPYDSLYWQLIGVLPGDRLAVERLGEDGIPTDYGVIARDGALRATYAAPPWPAQPELPRASLTRDGGLIVPCATGLCRTQAL